MVTPYPIPLLTALKQHNVLQATEINLPIAGHFGNLNLAYMENFIRMDFINNLIIEIFRGQRQLIKKQKAGNSIQFGYEGQHIKFKIEQLIYWIRKTCDQFIELFFLLSYIENGKGVPDHIRIDCIGNFVNNNSELLEKYDAPLRIHEPILKTINSISNAYKHTFINSDLLAMQSSEEPVVIALFQRNNKKESIPDFHSPLLSEIIQDIDCFLKTVKGLLIDSYPSGLNKLYSQI